MTDPEEITRFVDVATPSLADERKKRLRELFPDVFTEGQVEYAKLRASIGDLSDESIERYGFSWAGKRDAIRLLQTPTRATLVSAPAESVNFNTTQNLFIEGDNLEALKLLYKPYFGRVKMIYIDPPYNTGNDFIYPDNFSDPLGVYLRMTSQQDANGNLMSSNTETNGRFHSTWLSMMYPRLFLARQLLSDDGVVFISIDDNEVYNLRLIMNEIFGEENFVDCIIWKKRYGGGAKEKHLVTLHEYILFYAKNINTLDPVFIPNDPASISRYYKCNDEKLDVRGPFRTHPLEATKSMGDRKNLIYPIPAPDGTEILPKRQWLWGKERALQALKDNELQFIQGKDGWTVHTKQYLNDADGNPRQSKAFSIIDNVFTQHGTNEIIDLFGDAQSFPFPKPTALIKSLLQIATAPTSSDIVMDFFAGSGTTAQAVLELNHEDGGDRRFVLIQLPVPTDNPKLPTIAEIGKERIRRVIARIQERSTLHAPIEGNKGEDLGFRVFKLAPSNFRPWEGVTDISADGYAKQVALFAQNPFVDNWTVDAVIQELALKEGFGLSCRVEEVSGIEHQTFYQVTDADRKQFFLVCLDEHIDVIALGTLKLDQNTLLFCRDTALSDESAANLALQCRLKLI